jgi:prolyl oligopeptidase
MSTRFALVVAAAAGTFALTVAADVPEDPYMWLEEIESPKALEWARVENARSLGVLEKDPSFAKLHEEARAILTSPSRLSLGEIHGGAIYNFWQDETHLLGVWRRASVESYRKGKPEWETLIDFDQLASDENENWVAGEIVRLEPGTGTAWWSYRAEEATPRRGANSTRRHAASCPEGSRCPTQSPTSTGSTRTRWWSARTGARIL